MECAVTGDADHYPLSGPVRQDMLERIESIICGMPRVTREIFIAHRVEGQSCDEIASRMGLPTSKVEHHLVRALIILDKRLRGGRQSR